MENGDISQQKVALAHWPGHTRVEETKAQLPLGAGACCSLGQAAMAPGPADEMCVPVLSSQAHCAHSTLALSTSQLGGLGLGAPGRSPAL